MKKSITKLMDLIEAKIRNIFVGMSSSIESDNKYELTSMCEESDDNKVVRVYKLKSCNYYNTYLPKKKYTLTISLFLDGDNARYMYLSVKSNTNDHFPLRDFTKLAKELHKYDFLIHIACIYNVKVCESSKIVSRDHAYYYSHNNVTENRTISALNKLLSK